jgi:hypothetical protein
MSVHITQRYPNALITKRNCSHKEFAKLVILFAFAATADAFQPIALRSAHSKTSKFSGHSQRIDYLHLRQRKSTQIFTKELRAVGTLDTETAYSIAQA